MQHAINAKTDNALFAPGLQVNIAGALVKRVLPKPVHHLDHALIIGIELLVDLAQLHQLLKVGGCSGITGLFHRAHRLGQRKKLSRITFDIEWTRHHTAHIALGLALHLSHPVVNKRLGRGDHHLFG